MTGTTSGEVRLYMGWQELNAIACEILARYPKEVDTGFYLEITSHGEGDISEPAGKFTAKLKIADAETERTIIELE